MPKLKKKKKIVRTKQVNEAYEAKLAGLRKEWDSDANIRAHTVFGPLAMNQDFMCFLRFFPKKYLKGKTAAQLEKLYIRINQEKMRVPFTKELEAFLYYVPTKYQKGKTLRQLYDIFKQLASKVKPYVPHE